jgi:hypothetical protein
MRIMVEGLRRSEQALLLLVILTSFAMVLCSALMYFAESGICSIMDKPVEVECMEKSVGLCHLFESPLDEVCMEREMELRPWEWLALAPKADSTEPCDYARDKLKHLAVVWDVPEPDFSNVPSSTCDDHERKSLARIGCRHGLLASVGSRERYEFLDVACKLGVGTESYPSIAHTFWWSIVTLTTVGYGDAFPQTLLGKLVGLFTMLNGILLIALPMAMIGTEFQEVYHLIENEKASARRVALTDGKTSVRAALLDDRVDSVPVPPPVFDAHPAAPGNKPLPLELTPHTTPPLPGELIETDADAVKEISVLARIRFLEERIDQAEAFNKKGLEVIRRAASLATDYGRLCREIRAELTERIDLGGN